MSEKKVMMIAGANGFMGRYLSRYFIDKGWRVFGLARRTDGLAKGVEFIKWDGETYQLSWAEVIEEVDVLINLVGRTVNCRYNEENKRQILESRVNSTKLLGQAVASCSKPPSVWINGSTAALYKESRNKAQTESEGEMSDSFAAEVTRKWEATFQSAKVAESVRKIMLRTTLVMGEEKGTVYDILCGLAKKYLGGTLGDGGQMVSWIDINDVCRAVEWMINTSSASGAYNMASPKALNNAEMMKRIREKVGVSFGLPAFAWMLEIGAFIMRTEAELMTNSMYVYPERLINQGFVFEREEF
jgi:uncharacterized protein